ncbi:MAG TPA: hypothetical protein VFJ16_10240 [Longimicrobium sp.]|nr:hypothetical protein [Longimicrobium sp.]
MKKIRLDLQALRVESFTPAAVPPARGTVRGAGASFYATGCIQCGTQARMTCYNGCGTTGVAE